MGDPVGCQTGLRLRNLGASARFGVVCLVLVLLGGLVAAAGQVYFHHGPKDDVKGLTFDDIMGSYGGLRAPARLPATLSAGHPPNLDATARESLLTWLLGPKDAGGNRPEGGGKRIAEDYDNLDMGDQAPVELIAKNCLSCHSRKVAATNPIAASVPLDLRDDVVKLANAKNLTPVPLQILVLSTHTHALSLGALALATCALALATGWPRRLVGVCIALIGAGLLGDMAGPWIARQSPLGVYLMVVAGAIFSLTTAFTLVGVLVDLCLPRPEK